MSPTYNYKPLPDFLTIKKSKIHGKGLFMRKGCTALFLKEIGITHHIVNGKIIRTPLGGWLNDGGVNANCTLMPADDNGKRVPFGSQTCYVLVVNKYEVGGDELTLNYSNWEWILDGSLHPPLDNKYSAYDAQAAIDIFYSPYRVTTNKSTSESRGFDMWEIATFYTNPVDSKTNIVDEYIGAPGGYEEGLRKEWDKAFIWCM